MPVCFYEVKYSNFKLEDEGPLSIISLKLIFSFVDHPAVQHRIPLPASGWCCCWLSEDDVAVGLINGEFWKFIHAKFFP